MAKGELIPAIQRVGTSWQSCFLPSGSCLKTGKMRRIWYWDNVRIVYKIRKRYSKQIFYCLPEYVSQLTKNNFRNGS